MIWFSICIATLCIQIPNIWAIKKFAENPGLTQALWIGVLCLPTAFVSTAAYSYYYGKGFSSYSYPTLAIAAYGISLVTALLIQSFILKQKEIIVADYLSAFLVVSGLLIMIFRKEVTNLFG